MRAHGIEPHARPGKITLRAERRNGELLLEVRDNGDGLPSDRPRRAGIGIANTRDRLLQLYGHAQKFELINAEGGGLLARVVLPFKEKV